MQIPNIRVTRSKITVDWVRESLNPQKYQAQIRQELKKAYPTAKIGKSLGDNLFEIEEFVFTDKIYTEQRVTWIDTPLGTDETDVLKRLSKFPNSCLYKIISHSPILTVEQLIMIQKGILSIEKIVNSQIVLYGRGVREGEPILFNGKKQYKAIFFSRELKEDEDRRHLKEDVYVTGSSIAEEKEIELTNIKQNG